MMISDSASENRITLRLSVVVGVEGVLVSGRRFSFGVLLGEGGSVGVLRFSFGVLLGEGGLVGVLRLLVGDWFGCGLGEGGSLWVLRLLFGDWFVCWVGDVIVVAVGGLGVGSVVSVAVVIWEVLCSGRADLRNELTANGLEDQFR